jgi:hypothetical protein
MTGLKAGLESVVRPARIELATLGLGVPCSIQFELRARTSKRYIRQGFFYDQASLDNQA